MNAANNAPSVEPRLHAKWYAPIAAPRDSCSLFSKSKLNPTGKIAVPPIPKNTPASNTPNVVWATAAVRNAARSIRPRESATQQASEALSTNVPGRPTEEKRDECGSREQESPVTDAAIVKRKHRERKIYARLHSRRR